MNRIKPPTRIKPSAGDSLPSFGNPSFGNPSFGNPSFGNPSFGNQSVGNSSVGNSSVGNSSVGNSSVGNSSVGTSLSLPGTDVNTKHSLKTSFNGILTGLKRMEKKPAFSRKEKGPAFSRDSQPSINYNGSFPLDPEKKNIALACRHLSLLHSKASQNTRKPSLSELFKAEELSLGKFKNAEIEWNRFMRLSLKQLITPDALGKWLAEQGKELQRNATEREWITTAIITSAHVSTVTIEVKYTGEAWRYVIRYFDPDFTHSYIRYATNDLTKLERLTLSKLEGPLALTWEYPRALIMARLQRDFVQRVTSDFSYWNIDRLWLSLTYGLTEDLRQVEDEFKNEMNDEEKTYLLECRGMNFPGLFMAFQLNHAKCISLFGALLKIAKIGSRRSVLNIIRAEARNGTSGLGIALNYGQADAIAQFPALLRSAEGATDAEIASLIVAKNKAGQPAILSALLQGREKAIKSYRELIVGTSDSVRQFIHDELKSASKIVEVEIKTHLKNDGTAFNKIKNDGTAFNKIMAEYDELIQLCRPCEKG